VRIDSVPDEPGADDDPGPPAPGPAVDVDQASALELVVHLVEQRDEALLGRDREIADRGAHVSGRRRDQVPVRLELPVLRQVEEQGDASVEQRCDLDRCVLGAPGAGMPSGDQPTGLDDGGGAHAAGQSARPEPLGPGYPVRVAGLNGTARGADSSAMARLEAPTGELRDRALVLSTELGIDASAWYLRVLEEGRADGGEPDLGALVRAYWELQRVTGRSDLRDEWRRLADSLWAGELV
jgi:hypothetical protein